MITSIQGISAQRPHALTVRQCAHLTYVGSLESEIAERILDEDYQASIDVRALLAEKFVCYWRSLGYSVWASEPNDGYVTVTVDWSAPIEGGE